MTWTRRTLLMTGAAAAGTGLLGAAPAHAADEYDILRERWRTMLTGGAYPATAEPYATLLSWLAADAAAYRAAMAPTDASVWADLPLGTVSANLLHTFRRLSTLASAYTTPGTGLTGDATLLADVLTALDNLLAGHYTATSAEYDNWWHWQIGVPQTLQTIMVLLYDQLGATRITACHAAVDHHVPTSAVASYTGHSTGANRIDLCQVLALRGVLGKDGTKLAAARDGLSPAFEIVRSGDGFYPDGSFIQHTWVPYTGTYGAVLLKGFASILTLLTGSSWAVTDPNRQIIFDAVEKSFAPFLFNGLMMDCQSGRGISRGLSAGDPHQIQSDDHRRGHGIIADIITLAACASPAEAARWRGLAKGWLTRDYWSPPLNDLSRTIPELVRLQQVITDTTITPIAEPVSSRVFGSMDRAVHRRPGWTMALALSSARTTYYETGNGENLHGWHTGNGMTYWWGDSTGNGQYSDAFWPTVDPYRLPGTTTSRIALADAAGGGWGAPKPATAFVGGTTDGTYSVLGQDTRGLGSTLTGKKSWFCLGDQVVCLGAGITAGDGATVETTVDNRNLGPGAGTQALTVDGTAQPTTLGWNTTLPGTGWAHLAGFGGYVFPGTTTLRAVRENRTGTWREINTSGATTAVSRKYLTLWVDHGLNPTNAGYAYILLPGATATATAARAAAPTVNVLANTSAVQAVTDTATGVTAANFFTAGTAGPITVSAPCSVLLRETATTLTVTVADPTRAAATITVTVARTGHSTATTGPGVTVTGLNPITLTAEVGGTHGASRVITFGTGTAAATGTSTQLSPLADAYTRDGAYAATNYGTDVSLQIKNAAAGYARRAYLKFDLGAVPTSPRRAVLWVYGSTADSAGTQATLTAYGATDDTWTENGLTYSNQPALGPAVSTTSIGDSNDWLAFDVTAHVQARYAAGRIATVALAEAGPGNAVVLRSRQNTGNRPFLQVIA
ncbi:polysaccharide lyase family 8 super-sandwich domain-containing protein [Catellatospora sp. NPDC049609]|uniref:polysaccharide lyase family 8 super-sandwich domain-containing protein n=1 Tax=Catellatospora sp. NPDC049609 TaxID=3155505 RepID=UPI00343F51A7